MAWKKEYDAYFADTFDRDSTLCYAAETAYAADANKKLYDLGSGTLSFTMPNVNVNNDVLACMTEWNNNAKGVTTASIGFAVDGVDQVSSKIEDLQAQIDSLKKNLVLNRSCRKLRPALATLKYKREVE